MLKILRLKRVSWKSKNNVYICLIKDNKLKYEAILEDLKLETLDVLIVNESCKHENILDIKNKHKNIKIITLDLYKCISNESKLMVENIKTIDDIEVSDFIGVGALESVNISKEYYWKNILILDYI